VLNGSKMFITNAPYADVFVVYAKYQGIPTAPMDRRERPSLPAIPAAHRRHTGRCSS
jgi:alkylation response protein AidB-like acyl-CoA dehydrogenase